MLALSVVYREFEDRSGQTKDCCEFESRSDDVYSIQHYVIKFVSDLRQVGRMHRVLQFPPQTDRHGISELLLKMALNSLSLSLSLSQSLIK